MLKNYLKIAVRTLRRHKGYTLINVAGLAVGLAVSLLILRFVAHETSYDTFHAKADRTYRVLLHDSTWDETKTALPELVAPDLKAAFPEVASFARWSGPYEGTLINAGGQQFYEDDVLSADAGFFDVFSFRPVAGDLRAALSAPGEAVLTAPLARKFFGTEEAVGRTFTTGVPDSTGQPPTYTVTAVIEAVPSNSHLQFDLIRYEDGYNRRSWNYTSAKSYITLREGADVDAFRNKLPAFVQRNAAASAGEGENFDDLSLRLQPLTAIHLQPDPGAASPVGPVQYLYLFAAAAGLVLLIACINYMNLATARSLRRAREVGMRKTVGAHRRQIARQFLMEAVLMSLLAFGLALLLMRALRPLFDQLAGVALPGLTPGRLLLFAGVALVTGLLAGSYPAFVLSGFQPAAVLRGTVGRGRSGAGFRKALVVFQFAASIALIIATAVIWRQMNYVRAERLNTGDEEIVTLDRRALGDRFDTFKQALLARSSVRMVAAGTLPDGNPPARVSYQDDSTGTRTDIAIFAAGYDYLETLGITLKTGRDFAPERRDSNAVIVNEETVAWLDLDDPVGQRDERIGSTIVGVVDDFHLAPLYQKIGPLVMNFGPDRARYVLVRLRAGRTADGLAAVQDVWHRLVPEQPPRSFFLDEKLDEVYRADLRLGNVFGAFGLVAVFIAGLGLFGLAAFAAERRTKEIGIRKVLGASVASIVGLLSKDFLKLVLIAFALAAPLAYVAMRRWLQDFAYRVDLGPGVFLLAGAAALLIALLTVSYQAVRAATANPTEALRSE